MTYTELVQQFVTNALNQLTDPNQLFTLRSISPDSNIRTTCVLDFLRITRDMNDYALLDYAVNLSNNTTPDFQNYYLPKYKYLNLGQRFQAELESNTDPAALPLHTVVENEFDVLYTEPMSFTDLILMALIQLSVKKISDEQERNAYLKQIDDARFHRQLLADVKEFRLGTRNKDLDVYNALFKLADGLKIARDLIYKECLSLNDQIVRRFTENCLQYEFKFGTYRMLMEKIKAHYQPDEMTKLSSDNNMVIVKLLTSVDLEKDDLPISYPTVGKFRKLPHHFVYKLFYQATAHGIEMNVNCTALLIKLGVAHYDAFNDEREFPHDRLNVFGTAFQVLADVVRQDELVNNFMWLLELMKNNLYTPYQYALLNNFALNRVSASEQGSFDSSNLELIGEWLSSELLFEMFAEWEQNCKKAAEPNISLRKIEISKILLTAIQKYNSGRKGFKMKAIQTREEFCTALKDFDLSQEPLYNALLSKNHLVLKIESAQASDHLVVIHMPSNAETDDDGVTLKLVMCFGWEGNPVKAKQQALLHREVSMLSNNLKTLIAQTAD